MELVIGCRDGFEVGQDDLLAIRRVGTPQAGNQVHVEPHQRVGGGFPGEVTAHEEVRLQVDDLDEFGVAELCVLLGDQQVDQQDVRGEALGSSKSRERATQRGHQMLLVPAEQLSERGDAFVEVLQQLGQVSLDQLLVDMDQIRPCGDDLARHGQIALMLHRCVVIAEESFLRSVLIAELFEPPAPLRVCGIE